MFLAGCVERWGPRGLTSGETLRGSPTLEVLSPTGGLQRQHLGLPTIMFSMDHQLLDPSTGKHYLVQLILQMLHNSDFFF